MTLQIFNFDTTPKFSDDQKSDVSCVRNTLSFMKVSACVQAVPEDQTNDDS